MDKKFHRLYLHEIAFNQFKTTTITAILNKSKKYQGVNEKKHDFEMSMPS